MPATIAHITGHTDGKRVLLASIHTPSRGDAYLVKLAAAKAKRGKRGGMVIDATVLRIETDYVVPRSKVSA